MSKSLIELCIIILLLLAYLLYNRITRKDHIKPQINLDLTSTAFDDGGMMPVKYTGRGENVSPSLTFGNIDTKAKTTAIIMDDLDHPLGMYNHWVIWNIPARFDSIPESIRRTPVVSELGNAVQGRSDYGGKHYYRGPLPPFGTHEYEFKVYVLDCNLDIPVNTGKKKLQKAMEGHVLQYGVLRGKYGR
ncbi:MAG: YbhB/YbcL family Raf kinase inhibitor-like protein [Bacillota bacterium]|nr:YbhB/YbcL family Raf kinase inhibitor-like protein [Bacillota bacterium]